MRFKMILASSLSKKIYMSIAGLVWSAFLLVHLLGNLQLLNPDRDPFNKYSYFLTHQTGEFIYLAEFLLAFFFITHFLYAIWVQIGNWRARPHGYSMVRWAKNTSKRSLGSVTMIYTGALVLIFLVLHLIHFKYGEVVYYTPKGYTHQIRDMYFTVMEFFKNPVNVFFYVAVMVLLGFHLSHGAWSAFQSLGLSGKRFTPFIYTIGVLFAIVVAVGFVFLPLWIYFTRGGAL
ncbi:MAG: succinate dehydrogenase cytochrome b subunit [Calditrichaeota bacterium]|nr:succinate dehydrogenase cytochrome b subunit [Calditrichota bacterium]